MHDPRPPRSPLTRALPLALLAGFAVLLAMPFGLAQPVAKSAPTSLSSAAQADGVTGRDLVRAPITVFAVRHAEKGDDDPRDPGLTRAGEQRAEDLARLLSAAGVTHLYSTDYRRTRSTLAPLAAANALDVELYEPGDLAGLATLLATLPSGAVAVVAGHSNTTPGLVLNLGGDVEGLTTVRGAPALEEDQYDRLFQVTLPASEAPDARAKTIEFRYGH